MSGSLYSGAFTVVREEHYWVATHNETGIASHGDDPNEAIDMAIEAVELVREDPEPAPEAEQEELRREYGIETTEDDRGIDSPAGMP
jgi:predicted RNase H-like HicB family nuclease